MSHDSTDRNLLFGVFALQADLLDPARFAEACSAWASRKDVPLADLLIEREWITPEDRIDLDRLIDRRLKKHHGDVHASLAGLTTPAVREVLAGVADPDVQRSLDGLPPSAGHVLLSTVAYRPEGRGRYTVTHLHAKGGIGQVWLAEDSDLGRPVALKEVRPDRAASAEALARFLEEARITGQLEHPGIVPVYELFKGGPIDRPFYTMRFVRGRTLKEAAASFHGRRAEGAAGVLELRELLNAFVAVCNAVAYAHSRGVIHRDLKGSNVVLGDFGEVMVLDWGLAKVAGLPEAAQNPVTAGQAGSHEETHQGQVLGTPAYMPPEQAEGRIHAVNERSDVYGLGAILYEILTGKPPFPGTDSHAILRQVIHEIPDRPRRQVATVPAALEAVCLKALAKQPADRYPSATAVADEIRHWLADEAVTAYPEPWTTRARRWMGRHRTLATATAAALLVALVSLGAATVVLVEANRATRDARDLARRLQGEAETQRDQAKANFTLARDTVQEYTTKVANDARLKEKDLESLRLDLLKSATKFFQKLTRQGGDDPEVRADLGQAHRDLASLGRSTGDNQTAVGHGEKALAIFEKLTAEQPDNARFTRELARTCTELGSALALLGEAERPPQLYQRAIRLLAADKDPTAREYLAGAYSKLGYYLEDHESEPEVVTETFAKEVAILEELVAALPDDASQLLGLGNTYSDLGWRYLDIGNPKKAGELLEASLRALRAAVDKMPEDPFAQSSLGYAYHTLAQFERELENHEASLAAYQKTVAIQRRLVAAHPSIVAYQQALARSLNNLGLAHQRFGEREESIALLAEARELKERIVARYPDVPEYQADLARTLKNQSNSQPLAEAEKSLARARAIDEALAAKYPTVLLYQSDLASNHGAWARARERARKWDEAEAERRLAIRLVADLVSKNPAKLDYRRRLAGAHEGLAKLYVQWKKLDQAEASWREALAVNEAMAARHPDNLRVHADLGNALRNLANHQRIGQQIPAAAETYEQAIGKLQGAAEKAPTNVLVLAQLSDAYIDLAVLQGSVKETDRSIETCRQAIAVRQRLVDAYPEAPKMRAWLALGEHQLGLLLAQANRRDEAAEAHARAADIQEKLVADQPNVPAHQIALANTYAQQGYLNTLTDNAPEALAAFTKEQTVRRKLVEHHPESTAYQFSLARTGRKLGDAHLRSRQYQEAAAAFQSAVAVLEALLPKAAADQAEPWRTELAQCHGGLGRAYAQLGNRNDAIKEYRTAIELGPKLAGPHYNLGIALHANHQPEESIKEYRAAIELNPKYAEAHCNLGNVLRETGKLVESLEAYRKGHQLGSAQPGWRYPSAQWVRDAERWVELDKKLSAILEGKEKPANDAERIALARFCQQRFKKLYVASHRFFAEAFANDARFADDMQHWHRYNAACAAAQAGCGQGNDANLLDDKERARLRQQAVEWLRADLAHWTRQAVSDKPNDRAQVQQKMKHWLGDMDLAGIRSMEAVAKLPADEREMCQKLWADVAELLRRVDEKK